MQKQTNKLDWNTYFFNIAHVVAEKSKDKSTKNGCVIVDENNRIISTGYNGLIQGCSESFCDLDKRPDKYYYVIHAEMNALLFARQNLKNCKLYTIYAPCSNCLKHILQSGIREIYYEQIFVNSKQDNEITIEEKSIQNMIMSTNCKVYNVVEDLTWSLELAKLRNS